MSDNFEFKSLSEVEAMEKASDATTVLALDGGQVKQIPANQFGGGGNLIVTGDLTDAGIANASKTFAEMNSSIQEGVFPLLVAAFDAGDGFGVNLVAPVNLYIPNEGVGFLINYEGVFLQAICAADDTWQIIPLGG